jgi:hypothetical protein
MRERTWAIRYTRGGSQKTLTMEWPERPPDEEAARRVWKEELPAPKVIPTVDRRDPKPTISQLRMKGIEITAIEEVTD